MNEPKWTPLIITLVATAGLLGGLYFVYDSLAETEPAEGVAKAEETADKVVKSDAEWSKELTPEQYRILRKKGTERAGSGKYNKHKEKGAYVCGGCGLELFSSEAKYDSGSGWPSFWKPVNDKNVAKEVDRSFGSTRTEVLCRRCGGHLGHVFNDGPKPTGQRYCVNSASLEFKKAKTDDKP